MNLIPNIIFALIIEKGYWEKFKKGPGKINGEIDKDYFIK